MTMAEESIQQVGQVQPDLIAQIFTQPYIWIAICLGMVVILIIKLKGRTARPEQRPFWGIEVRDNMTQKQMRLRSNILGINFSYVLYKGMHKMGKTVNLEPIYRKVNGIEQEFYHIGFREFGIVAWIKYWLLGKYEHIVLDPVVMSFDKTRRRIYINPKAYIIHDSGVWTLSTFKDTGWVDELNLKADIENVKGFTSDFLRRLSNEAPLQAMATEKMQHQSELDEKAKASRVKRWEG